MRKPVMTVLFGLLLCISFSCSKDEKTEPSGDDAEVPPMKESYPGLSVSSSGELLLNGEPYQGIGVNYFNGFTRTLEDGSLYDDTYRAGFTYLKERNIPFVRFSLTGFWPKNWDLYLNQKEKYFRSLDSFITAAEEIGIGLIPSFFWHTPTLPDLAGEPVNRWGVTSSRTHQLMRKFIREVVVRYRDSPAVWGWEQGNEVNLLVDLPGDNSNLPPVVPSLGTPVSRSKEDKLQTADLNVMMTSFAKEIRKYDGTRIVISGNSIPRFAAWNLLHQKQWTPDSREQYVAILGIQNPDPVNVLCIHAYPAAPSEGYFSDETADFNGLIRASVDASRIFHKPLFLGEWGAQETEYGAQTRTKFMEILNAIENNQVPLSAMWVFDYPPHDTENGINVSPDNGPREYMLQEIMKVNERMANR